MVQVTPRQVQWLDEEDHVERELAGSETEDLNARRSSGSEAEAPKEQQQQKKEMRERRAAVDMENGGGSGGDGGFPCILLAPKEETKRKG